MNKVLVDSNVILDIVTENPTWFDWSARQLKRLADKSVLVINPIIYSEVSIGFDRVEDLDIVLSAGAFHRENLPWDATFLAGKCFLKYRRSGGNKRSPLPDFFIGAHAAIQGFSLLTRDASRYKSYFPKLTIISP